MIRRLLHALVASAALMLGGLPRKATIDASWTLAPAAVTDLQARALTDSAVVLQWTEVRSSTTAIPRYVVRYDSAGKLTWGTHADLLTTGCAAPIIGSNAAGGRLHACVLWDLKPWTRYDFQIAAYTGTLGTATFGPLSNVASATTMQRVGPMLVWRPGMWFADSLRIAAASVSDYGDVQFPYRGWFKLGDRTAVFYDSLGAVVARGYLVVTK